MTTSAAVAEPATLDEGGLVSPEEPMPVPKRGGLAGMSRRRQIGLGIVAVYVVGLVVFGAVFGLHAHKNNSFSIVSPYHLTTWVHLIGPIELDKGVMYLLVTALISIGILLWVARRMEMRPNRIQTLVEWGYDLCTRLSHDNMDEEMARKWFPLVFALFVFVLVTNLMGYIPLPVNTVDKLHLAGFSFPSFQIYATDTNVALPFLLAFSVFIAYNVEGFRHQGFRGYIKSMVPSDVSGGMLLLLYPIEIMSHFLRLLSLTVRLWANLLAGHLLIDFMAGDMAVLFGLPFLGWALLPFGVAIYLFECVLIAGLQAFIFAILAAIYLGGAVGSH